MNPLPPLDPWSRQLERWPAQIAFALAMAMAGLLLRLALDPMLGDRQPYATAYATVAVATWFGGWRSGVITVVAGVLWGNYFFVPPRGALTFAPSEAVGATTYVLVASLIVFLGHKARVANRALRVADATKDHFIATLSHELRNPLAPIVNGVQLLKQNRALDEGGRATVDMLDRQTRHMSRLLDDLLDLSRITRGRLELQLEPVDLRACIEHAIEIAQPRGSQAREIVVRVASDLPVLRADRTRLTQVVGNLLHNAVKFAPPRTPIEVEATRDDGDVLIAVRDQGPGIDSSMLPGLFSPFNKPVEMLQTQGSGGLGIGLWLANRLAELHGGRIQVERPAAGGVVMIVRLPASRD